MAMEAKFDAWSQGQSYEHYMGRWSQRIAAAFLAWLRPATDRQWLEIGCGTGALTSAILAAAAPCSIIATDASKDFVEHARAAVPDERVRYLVADALSLPSQDHSIDIVASALVLNFIADRPAALAEMRRVLRPDGQIAFYVWDYPGGGVGFIDAFWKAAAEIDPEAAALPLRGGVPHGVPVPGAGHPAVAGGRAGAAARRAGGALRPGRRRAPGGFR